MESKECTICKISKSLTDFAIKNREKGKYSSDCKVCHREIRKKYYRDNYQKERERLTKTHERYKKECRERIRQFKIKSINWGEDHPAV